MSAVAPGHAVPNGEQRPPTAGKRIRRRRILPVVFLALVGAWAVNKASNTRRAGTSMRADTSCRTDPSTAADMSQLAPGAAPIACQPWDIGTGVTGYVWHAPNARAVLLLQHGWGDYSQRYVEQNARLIPHLLSIGVSVYAFDMWGNGRSPGKRGLVDVPQAVGDHLAARRKLREQPETRSLPLFLFGHSLGGLVTATSMVHDQSSLSGAMLLAPAINHVSPVLRRVGQAGAFLVPTLEVPAGEADISLQTRLPETQRKLTRDTLMMLAGLPWLSGGGWATVSHENWTRYRDVRVPVLVAHGTADKVADPAASRELIERIASSDKTLHPLEGVVHSPLDDLGQEDTRRVILAWLEKRLPPWRRR